MGESEARAARREGGGGRTSAPADSAPCGRRLVGWRKWLLRVVLMVVSPLAVLTLVEVVLWLAGFGYPTGFLITSDGGATWTENPRFFRRFSSPGIELEPEPIRLAGAKPAGSCRIFVLGESAAQGTPEPAYSFGRILQVMLRERHGGAAVEVINAAVMGISSHAMVPIARDCAKRNPDVFIIYAGNNEIIGPWSPFTAPAPLASYRPLIQAALWAKATRVGQLAEAAFCKGAERQTIETFLGSAIAPDDPRRGTVRDHFRANLRDVLHIVRDAGARAVVATVATNLRDFAPLASLHRSDLCAADRAEWDRRFAAAEAAEAGGRLTQAIDHYQRALEVDDRYAEAHYRLGRGLLALGRYDEAGRHFALARDCDALPFRIVGCLNAAARALASGRETEGIYLVDAEAAFEAAAQPWGGVPGEESFYEHCHMTFAGNYCLAAAMLPAVEAAAGIGEAAGPVPSVTRCGELLALTEWDNYRMAVEMLRVVAKPPFTNQSDHVECLERLRRKAASLGALETPELLRRQVRLYEDAIRRAPDDWCLHHKFAILKFDSKDFVGSAAEFREVLRIMPHHIEARVRLGDALARQGLKDDAVALWNQSLCERPECLQAISRMVGEMAAQGKIDQAIEWAEKAIDIRPDASQYEQLGSLLAQQGKAAAAVDQYRRGLALHPDDLGLRKCLAEALAAQKSFAEAAAEFEAVLRVDPHHVAARCALARALATLGEIEKAATQWRMVLALNPASQEARGALAKLHPTAGLDPVLGGAKVANSTGDVMR